MIGKPLRSTRGGGFAIMFISLGIIVVAFAVLIYSADYALYTYKTRLISDALDYSVCAAVQEIDTNASLDGLGNGYDEYTGMASLKGIELNTKSADNAFYSTFLANTGIRRQSIEESILTVITSVRDTGFHYNIRAGKEGTPEFIEKSGILSDTESLEERINNALSEYWRTDVVDRHVIYVNGNIKTNSFKERPYYIVVIKNYEIGGLFAKRMATFIGFKGAKLERQS